MAGAGALYDATKVRMLADLAEIRRRHGAAYAGVVVEAVIAGCADFVRTSEGAEAAFNVLTRHADTAAAPLLSDDVHPSQPE